MCQVRSTARSVLGTTAREYWPSTVRASTAHAASSHPETLGQRPVMRTASGTRSPWPWGEPDPQNSASGSAKTTGSEPSKDLTVKFFAVTFVPAIPGRGWTRSGEAGQALGDGLRARPGTPVIPRCAQGEHPVLAQRVQAFRGGPIVLLHLRSMGAQNLIRFVPHGAIAGAIPRSVLDGTDDRRRGKLPCGLSNRWTARHEGRYS
jgi:hypothetical protein